MTPTNSLDLQSRAATAHNLWFVLKGVALGDDLPGKDFDAVPASATDEELEVSIANVIGREQDDIELLLYLRERRAQTLGRHERAGQLVMGLRVYVVEAASLDALCHTVVAMRPSRLIYRAAWPVRYGLTSALVASGMPALLGKQLRMLAKEGVHCAYDEGSG